MKNYELDLDKSKYFILNYEIVKDEIIVNLATGDKYPIPYTIENEKKILEQMKKQVTECNSAEFIKNQHLNRKLIIAIVSIIIALFNIISCGINIIPPIASITSMITCTIIATYNIIKLDDAKIVIADIKKNKEFIRNEIELNANVKNNPNCLSNTTEKTREIISQNKSTEQNITINTIDQISYEDLQKILGNIKFEKTLNIEHPEQQKTLIKK